MTSKPVAAESASGVVTTEASSEEGGLATRAFAPRASACGVSAGPPVLDGSRVLRHDGAGWDDVRVQRYDADAAAFPAVTRRVLAAPGPAGFELRYFEVESDGCTRLERHDHVHVVVCYRGRGRVRLGDAEHELGFGDVVYVAPGDVHQFMNPYGEPFGFLCIVDRERDRPAVVDG